MFLFGLIVGLMISTGAGFCAAALCRAAVDGDKSTDDFEKEAGLTVKDTPELRAAIEAFERDGAVQRMSYAPRAAWDGAERRRHPRVSMSVPVAVRVVEQVQDNPYKRGSK